MDTLYTGVKANYPYAKVSHDSKAALPTDTFTYALKDDVTYLEFSVTSDYVLNYGGVPALHTIRINRMVDSKDTELEVLYLRR